MELDPTHLQALMDQAQARAEVIRARIAWVEERRRELWQRMDAAAPAANRLDPRLTGAAAPEIGAPPVYPIG